MDNPQPSPTAALAATGAVHRLNVGGSLASLRGGLRYSRPPVERQAWRRNPPCNGEGESRSGDCVSGISVPQG